MDGKICGWLLDLIKGKQLWCYWTDPHDLTTSRTALPTDLASQCSTHGEILTTNRQLTMEDSRAITAEYPVGNSRANNYGKFKGINTDQLHQVWSTVILYNFKGHLIHYA